MAIGKKMNWQRMIVGLILLAAALIALLPFLYMVLV